MPGAPGSGDAPERPPGSAPGTEEGDGAEVDRDAIDPRAEPPEVPHHDEVTGNEPEVGEGARRHPAGEVA
jgi:hypothetical protein